MKKLILMVIVCAVIAGSCGPQPDNTADGPISSAVVKHQNDVPVPVNFTYIPEKSRVETFTDFRLCEMLYESGPDARHGLNALKNFYMKMMPKYDWVQVQEKLPRNHLIFKKTTGTGEFVRIEIFRDGSKSMIYILIGNEKLIKAEK